MLMKRTVAEAEKKALDGDFEAERNLEYWYKEGMNELPKDEAMASEWHDAAELFEAKAKALNGDVAGMLFLATVHRNGSHRCARSDTRAFEWYVKASDAGDTGATTVVGAWKVNGCGTNRNVASGLIYLAAAANDGLPLACFHIGKYAFLGQHGIEKDAKQAKKWLQLAVDDGGLDQCHRSHAPCMLNELNGSKGNDGNNVSLDGVAL